jgi:hypothetical protein
MSKAACKGLTHLMFPAFDGDKSYCSQARKICQGCPVRKECLDYALEFQSLEMHGVWAGLTSNQLGQEQRRRGIKPSRATSLSVISEGFDRIKR